MYVEFISDGHYKGCVRYVLNSFNKAKELKSSLDKSIAKNDIFKSLLFKNKIDPFKMVFEIEKIGIKEWIRKEILRQLDKSVEQKMGEFHQRMLGGVNGWKDLKVGNKMDIVNMDGTIYFEIKNKFNTSNDGSLKDVRNKLEEITKSNHKATAYWANIIPNSTLKSGEAVWVKKNFNQIESVKRVWGEKVYELITGDPLALEKIYQTLPTVIADVAHEDDIKNIAETINAIVESLDEHLDNIQSQIYAQVFKN